MSKTKPKALVLFSGGLDSTLAAKLLQRQGIEVETAFFMLPFAKPKIPSVPGIKQYIIDCTKGDLFREYLKKIHKPKYGYGTAINPCKDCKIFILKTAKELAEKVGADFIATGEVLGQRPMSQQKRDMPLLEKEAGLRGWVLRPLSAKLLEETEIEKQGLVKREELEDINGRQRKRQMALAKELNMEYPSPGGGCLLCEKSYKIKLKDIFNHTPIEIITFEEIAALNGGRHFRTDNGKIILSRNEKESNRLAELNKVLNYSIIIPTESPGPTAIFESEKDRPIAQELLKAFSSKNLELRKNFDEIKI